MGLFCYYSNNIYLCTVKEKTRMQLYIFDFDGTLGDSKSLILGTMMDTFDAMGLPRPTESECVATIGLPLAECFEQAAGMDKAMGERCAAKYREIFARNNVPGAVKPFDGVLETLRMLHAQGKTMAVASSRGHESLDILLRDFGITELFQCIIGADDVTNHKPDPEPVNKILSALHFSPEDALVVGDAPFDILMGRNAGAKTCAVTYGNGKPDEMRAAKPDYIIDNFKQVLTIG